MWKPSKPPFRNHKKKVFGQIIETGKFIYQIGETETLRQKSIDVKVSEIKTSTFTAIQIGIQERFAVIYMPKVIGRMLIIINPVITKRSTKLLKYPEVCMSANPIIANIVRPSWVEVEYYDEFGKKQYWNRKDSTKEDKIYNRVFQHEIDHMEGIINIDKVPSKELILQSDPSFYKSASFIEV